MCLFKNIICSKYSKSYFFFYGSMVLFVDICSYLENVVYFVFFVRYGLFIVLENKIKFVRLDIIFLMIIFLDDEFY